MQVVEFNITLRDAQQAYEILRDLRYLSDDRVKQTSTNTYEIADVDDDLESECANWELYSNIYDTLDSFGIEFYTENKVV